MSDNIKVGVASSKSMDTTDLDEMKFESEIYFPTYLQRGIREAIREGIKLGIRTHCRMPIDDKEAQQVRFMFDEIKTLGNGSIHKGLDIAFNNHHEVQKIIAQREDKDWLNECEENKADHRTIRRLRKRLDTLSGRVGSSVLTAVLLAILGILWLGIKHNLGNNTP